MWRPTDIERSGNASPRLPHRSSIDAIHNQADLLPFMLYEDLGGHKDTPVNTCCSSAVQRVPGLHWAHLGPQTGHRTENQQDRKVSFQSEETCFNMGGATKLLVLKKKADARQVKGLRMPLEPKAAEHWTPL